MIDPIASDLSTFLLTAEPSGGCHGSSFEDPARGQTDRRIGHLSNEGQDGIHLPQRHHYSDVRRGSQQNIDCRGPGLWYGHRRAGSSVVSNAGDHRSDANQAARQDFAARQGLARTRVAGDSGRSPHLGLWLFDMVDSPAGPTPGTSPWSAGGRQHGASRLVSRAILPAAPQAYTRRQTRRAGPCQGQEAAPDLKKKRFARMPQKPSSSRTKPKSTNIRS